jgi:hypothetical protein
MPSAMLGVVDADEKGRAAVPRADDHANACRAGRFKVKPGRAQTQLVVIDRNGDEWRVAFLESAGVAENR